MVLTDKDCVVISFVAANGVAFAKTALKKTTALKKAKKPLDLVDLSYPLYLTCMHQT
jgi:hypothetical protein